MGYVQPGEWLNYTRTFPAGRYHVYGRFSYGSADGRFEAQMDRVTSDPSKPAQVTEKLGAFRRERGTEGWMHHQYFALLDDDGKLAVVQLDGEETVRVTDIGNGYGVAYYMLVPADE